MSYNIPYSFIPGTKAKAQEVNANFSYVLNSLDEVNSEKLNKSLSNLTQEGLEVIKNNISSKNIGEIVTSLVPINDDELHLLDGSLISGDGIYKAFVDYIADLYAGNSIANYFTTESLWQQSVTDYGVCGKFVYDSVNNTVRLPKVSGIIEGTTDASALGDLVKAGLPNILGGFKATMYAEPQNVQDGAFTAASYTSEGLQPGSYGFYRQTYEFDASDSNSIYGNSSTVQPQTIKAFYYIVIATSSKTDIQVDIDEVATDLNGKADTDLTNVTDTGYIKMAGASMPSNTYVDLTLGASGSTYTAPADGWITFRFEATAAGAWMYAGVDGTRITKQQSAYNAGYQIGTTFPVLKGQTLTLMYSNINTTPLVFRFIYAKGSESEAN